MSKVLQKNPEFYRLKAMFSDVFKSRVPYADQETADKLIFSYRKARRILFEGQPMTPDIALLAEANSNGRIRAERLMPHLFDRHRKQRLRLVESIERLRNSIKPELPVIIDDDIAKAIEEVIDLSEYLHVD